MLGVISFLAPRLYQNYGYTLGHPHQMFFRELDLGYHNLSSDDVVSYADWYLLL